MREYFQTDHNSRQNRLLVALPRLDGSAFERTMIWLWQDSARTGAQGVVLNRPSMVSADQIIQEMGYCVHQPLDDVVHQGGPVSERSLSMIHSTDWYSSNTHSFGDVSISSDLFMLEKMAVGNTPDSWRLFAGKSAWAQGQLEREITAGYWAVMAAEPELVFSERTGLKLWEDSIALMGSKAVSQWF